MKLPQNIESVNSMLQIALNMKPKGHKRLNLTRAEQSELLDKLCADIQSRLITLECLEKAVNESSDAKAIAARTRELFDGYVAGLKNSGESA